MMIRTALGITAAVGLLAGIALSSDRALAQYAGDAIAEIIVYGNDRCPSSNDDEVVVCARKPESERYRIPEKLRQGGSLQSRQAWAERAKSLEYVGRTGIQSCSPVGPGGHTGCLEPTARRRQGRICEDNADYDDGSKFKRHRSEQLAKRIAVADASVEIDALGEGAAHSWISSRAPGIDVSAGRSRTRRSLLSLVRIVETANDVEACSDNARTVKPSPLLA